MCNYEGGAAMLSALNNGGASEMVIFNCNNDWKWFKGHDDNVDNLVEIFAR